VEIISTEISPHARPAIINDLTLALNDVIIVVAVRGVRVPVTAAAMVVVAVVVPVLDQYLVLPPPLPLPLELADAVLTGPADAVRYLDDLENVLLSFLVSRMVG